MDDNLTKKTLACELGLPRLTLYYQRKLPPKDLLLLEQIRQVLRLHLSYGYWRVATNLKINGKRALRVMKLFGVKLYWRRGRKPFLRTTDLPEGYPNLIRDNSPTRASQI